MTIYLIRHGRTVANERHLYCGSTDLPLSEGGRSALQSSNLSIKNVRFITSGMKRTNETLRCLFGDVPYETDNRFREVDFGRFEMQSYAELQHDPAYQDWISGDNEVNVPPQGESGQQMTARVLDAFRAVQQENLDTAIVTHGGVIAAIMQNIFLEAGKNRYEWQPKPGCGYLISDGQYEPIGEE